VGKYIPAWIIQKSFRYSIDQRRLIFGLSNAQAAAILAAVLVGYHVILSEKADGEPKHSPFCKRHSFKTPFDAF
jgi:hypothetical protein